MSVSEFISIKTCLLVCLLFGSRPAAAQQKEAAFSIQSLQATAFSGNGFVENIGQYGREIKGWEQLGPITHGFDGLDMPVLFTTKGIIHLHRKIKTLSHEEEERLEKAGVPEEEIERRKTVIDRMIALEWEASNPAVEIIPGETQTLKWVAEKPGMFPFYCTDFCSALHQEMQGYIRISPAGSNVPLLFSTGKNLPVADSAAAK